jgi:hypothetical protein
MKGSQPSTLIKGRFRTLLVANPIDAACRSHGPKGAPQQSVGCQVRRVLEAWSIGHGPLTKNIYGWWGVQQRCVCVGEMCCKSWYLQMQAVVDDTFDGCWPFHGRPTYRINIHERDLAPATFSSPCTGATRLVEMQWNALVICCTRIEFKMAKRMCNCFMDLHWSSSYVNGEIACMAQPIGRIAVHCLVFCFSATTHVSGVIQCCENKHDVVDDSAPGHFSVVCRGQNEPQKQSPPKDWAKDKLLDCEVFGLPQSWLEIFGIGGTWKFWWKVAQVAFQDTALLHNHWSCPYCLLANLAKP